ncbi:heterokaryon incompatibility protein-domain-containing protein [Triangularia setosa]|uniref:Heterokaryon incompatibility protein-domain-containing protein n=1 Tax=Triangularia setosa TaxID=2587417 RepID=A0AAN6W9I5_9PEZI|nr:heterokaryon incompatibility protein-domain-containing protein [Podospora setosa]
MWIDALCIDQSNLKERGKQVQLMKDIYSSGKQAIVYLGDGKNHRPRRLADQQMDARAPLHADFHNSDRDEVHIESFWDALSASIMSSSSVDSGDTHQPRLRPRHLSSTFHMFCLLRILGNEVLISNLIGKLRKFNYPSFDPLGTLVENLRAMLLNPWWQRIWVVQEMIVSRVTVVRCGPVTCPWDMFISAASSISRSSLEMSTLFRPDSVKVLQYFCRQVLSFHDLRNEWQKNLGVPMLTLLQDFSARRATDERDKVFALLGLSLPTVARRFLALVSYEDTVADVYRSTAMEVICRSHSLDIWCGDMARKNRRDLDSWVPDWSAVYDEADRRRARFAQVRKGERRPKWKLTVVKSEGEYWKFVAEGMTLLWHWVKEEKESRRLPLRLLEVMVKYRTELNKSLGFYKEYGKSDLTKTVERIQELCLMLEGYCTRTVVNYDAYHDPFISFFTHSAAFYREIKAQDTRSETEHLKEKMQFDRESGAWLDRLQVAHDSKAFPGFTKPDVYKHNRQKGLERFKSFLSVESAWRGSVEHVSTRLLSWDDQHSAFNTISQWAAHHLRLEGNDKLKLAKTLIGSTSFLEDLQGMTDVDNDGGEEKSNQDAMLLEWFDGILKRKDFQNDAKMKSFDKALLLATGGRVMFSVKRGVLGLGPGSMVVGDEVGILPGGSNHIVLRRIPKETMQAEGLEGPAYTVVGDCCLHFEQVNLNGRLDWSPEFWPGWLPEFEHGWLPEEMAHALKDPQGLSLPYRLQRQRIYLF